MNFTNFDSVRGLHSQLLLWCTDSLKELELQDDPEIVAESLRGDLNEVTVLLFYIYSLLQFILFPANI